MSVGRYIYHCERVSLADVTRKLVRTDPTTGDALMPRRYDGAFAGLVGLGDPTRCQRVPITTVTTAAQHHVRRFVCSCGALARTLYRSPDRPDFACRRCVHITHTRPSSGPPRRTRAELAAMIEAGMVPIAMARLKERLNRARAGDIAGRAVVDSSGDSQLISANRDRA